MENVSIERVFAKYVLLNIISMIGISAYILADTVFIARGIGADGLTALNLALPLFNVIQGSGLMIGMGASTRFSISKSEVVFTQALYFALFLSLILAVIGFLFSDNLSLLLGADEVTKDMTSSYLKVILMFSPMFMLNNTMLCFVRNDNNPKLAMIAMTCGSISNIILDYVYVFPMNLGIFGAALATGTAPVVSLIIQSSHIWRKKNSFHVKAIKPTFSVIKDIGALGVSSLISEMSSGVVIVVFNFVILGLAGNTGVAAYGIIVNIALVIISIFTGISEGIQPLVSRSYGKGEKDNVKKVYKYGVITAISISIVVYLVSFIYAEPIVTIFNRENDPVLMNMAVDGMKFYFTAFIFVGINVITSIFFSSTDNPKPAFIISIMRGFVVIVPMAFIMSRLFGMTGVWWTLTVSELIVSCFSMFIVRKNI